MIFMDFVIFRKSKLVAIFSRKQSKNFTCLNSAAGGVSCEIFFAGGDGKLPRILSD
jgi:hypothetical protein